jgi:hypothetical protein
MIDGKKALSEMNLDTVVNQLVTNNQPRHIVNIASRTGSRRSESDDLHHANYW